MLAPDSCLPVRPTCLASWAALTLAWFICCFAVAGSDLVRMRYSRSSLLWVFHHFVLRSLAWNLSADQVPETACLNRSFSSGFEFSKPETKPYCSASSALDRVGVAVLPVEKLEVPPPAGYLAAFCITSST